MKMFAQNHPTLPNSFPPMNVRKKNSCRDTFAPADILFGMSLIVLMLGCAMIVVGGALSRPSEGLTAHLSITYVGIAVFLAGLTTFAIAIHRIVITNRRLKQMGLTTREFVNQWNQEELMIQLTAAQQRRNPAAIPPDTHY